MNDSIKVWQWVVTVAALAALVWIGVEVFSTPRQVPLVDKCGLCA